MKMAEYRYFDAVTRGVDFAGMLADLGRAAPGDVVLLHGCCHNPTGANLAIEDWQAVTDLLNARGADPVHRPRLPGLRRRAGGGRGRPPA